jgi:hypothetical protein
MKSSSSTSTSRPGWFFLPPILVEVKGVLALLYQGTTKRKSLKYPPATLGPRASGPDRLHYGIRERNG